MKTKEEKNRVGEPLGVFHVCCAFGSQRETKSFPPRFKCSHLCSSCCVSRCVALWCFCLDAVVVHFCSPHWVQDCLSPRWVQACLSDSRPISLHWPVSLPARDQRDRFWHAPWHRQGLIRLFSQLRKTGSQYNIHLPNLLGIIRVI